MSVKKVDKLEQYIPIVETVVRITVTNKILLLLQERTSCGIFEQDIKVMDYYMMSVLEQVPDRIVN